MIGNQSGPRLLILAGVHGDEYEPIAAVRQLLKTIDAERLSGQVTLVPVVNHPAFQRVSRTGPDQLDLARTMPGREDGSITEQIAWETAKLIHDCDYLIDLHTGGLAMQISPLSGYLLHEDPNVLNLQRRMATAFNLPIIWGTSPKLNGRTLSIARDANIPAIYAEWGGGTGCDPQGVSDYVNGCLNVMRELNMIHHPQPENQARCRVEDHRYESGIFQKNYPAPHAGFFEPVVTLNDHVQPGDILGWVHSVAEDRSTAVRSVHQGIVILLRVIPSVNPGDCLSTVLEADGDGEFHYE